MVVFHLHGGIMIINDVLFLLLQANRQSARKRSEAPLDMRLFLCHVNLTLAISALLESISAGTESGKDKVETSVLGSKNRQSMNVTHTLQPVYFRISLLIGSE